VSSDLYRMGGPTAWAEAPELFSYSTLLAIETCPRRWQLEHSRYGEFDSLPIRPAPAAVEGQIVHEILDRLFKALALRGLPPLGSADFRAAGDRAALARLRWRTWDYESEG
jgi:PD-(D/E)XK nuclease superfamily